MDFNMVGEVLPAMICTIAENAGISSDAGIWISFSTAHSQKVHHVIY
jgi:hypothetical protein